MDTAEQLGQAFDLDVTDEAFWTASLDVVRARMANYAELAALVGGTRARTPERHHGRRRHRRPATG